MNNGNEEPSESDLNAKIDRLQNAVFYLIERAAQTQATAECFMNFLPELLTREDAGEDVRKHVSELYLKYLLDAQKRFGPDFLTPPNQS